MPETEQISISSTPSEKYFLPESNNTGPPVLSKTPDMFRSIQFKKQNNFTISTITSGLTNLTSKPSIKKDKRNRKNSRTFFTAAQVAELERSFTETPYLDYDRKTELAGKTNLSERHVKVWFQNRRSKDQKHLKLNSTEQEPSPLLIKIKVLKDESVRLSEDTAPEMVTAFQPHNNFVHNPLTIVPPSPMLPQVPTIDTSLFNVMRMPILNVSSSLGRSWYYSEIDSIIKTINPSFFRTPPPKYLEYYQMSLSRQQPTYICTAPPTIQS